MTATKTCSIDGCDRKFKGRGMCATHIWREKHHGSPHAKVELRTYSIDESLAARTERRGDCLIWTGATSDWGYGRMSTPGGRLEYVHRVTYAREHGPIPEGMMVDHRYRCDPACCEPSHLRLATRAENGWTRSGAPSNNSSGYRGIRPQDGGWAVQVRAHGVKYGTWHKRFADALSERDALWRELHGEFSGRG